MKRSSLSTAGFSTLAAIFFSQLFSPAPGHSFARLIGRVVGLFPNGSAYRSLRVNQWIASGKQLVGRALDQAVKQVFVNQGSALYDFYRALSHPEIAREKVSFTPAFDRLVEECRKEQVATLLLIPHLSGFNLGGLRLVQEGLRYLTLVNPDTSKAYAWQNELRNRNGMEVEPFTIHALGLARERLKSGGTVLTGIDRPLENSKYAPRFFGYPSALPVAYVRLALKSAARVFVVGFTTLKDHTHLIDVSEQVQLVHYRDGAEELERNAEKVLQQAEVFIRRDPAQWMMFTPVWPEEMAKLEGEPG